jgi:tetratricopeptide (TPR) repeat protein
MAGVVLAVATFTSVGFAAQQVAPVSPAGAAFAQGVQLHDGGKPADAIALFKQAIDLGYQPANQARFRLARAYARAGNTELALAELEVIAAAGFANTAVLSINDLDGLRALPRFKAFESRVNANARPCDNDPRFHAFDFWIGEWDVQPTGNVRAPTGQGATSVIEAQLGGCVIQENWMPNGPVAVGKSFNIYNTATKLWEQYYVDSRGTVTHYKGAFKDDGNLYFEADQPGAKNKVRMTFFNQGPNQVRQLGQISTDGGKTWTVTFDLTYVRKIKTLMVVWTD